MSARIIAFANQKGGVGKTTCCVNLSAIITHMQKRVLLVDLDPQGNATMGAGLNKSEVAFTIGDVLQDKVSINKAIAPSIWFDILPSNIEVTEAEVNLTKTNNKQQTLKYSLDIIKNNYDFIFIDCPPSLNILTINALIAADSILIPMQCEYYALEGLSALMNTFDGIKCINKSLVIEGILRTMYDPRNKLCKDVSLQLIEHFGKLVYSTVIPRNIRLAESPSHGMPIISYEPNSKGSKAYIKLAKELLKNYSQLSINKYINVNTNNQNKQNLKQQNTINKKLQKQKEFI